MNAFFSILDQMLFLFLCMAIGFILNRRQVLPKDADTIISRLLSNIFLPAMIIGSFKANCTPANLRSNLPAILFCAGMLAISAVIAFILSPKLAEKPDEIGLYRYSLIITNFGFMGYSLVRGVLGEEALYQFLVFAIPASFVTYTFGVIWLTAGKRKGSWKMLVNLMFVALILGIILGLFQIPLPSIVTKAVDSCGNCFSPLAMILTGFVIANYDIKSLLVKKAVYKLTLIRLILMPLFFYGLCRLFRVPSHITTMILIFSAMPLGLNTIVFPAAYGGDETPGASMAIISNIAGLITIPLLLSLVL